MNLYASGRVCVDFPGNHGLICGISSVPLLNLFRSSVWIDGQFSLVNFRKFFGRSYYYSTIFNSFKIAVCTRVCLKIHSRHLHVPLRGIFGPNSGYIAHYAPFIWPKSPTNCDAHLPESNFQTRSTAITLFLGFWLAYIYTMYEIRGKTFLQILIILCSMSAPFISAYSWILLMGRNGLVRTVVKTLTGASLPTIYGFGGILLVLSLQMFPLVFLYISGALKNIDNSLLEAAENMGVRGVQQVVKVVIPLCMPTILASGLLVFMKSFADFGTPLLIGEGYLTFPVLIYRQYFGETGSDSSFAAALCLL